ncbi:hypothetical protein FRB99_002695, partial [Tulasnella sp. 403]
WSGHFAQVKLTQQNIQPCNPILFVTGSALLALVAPPAASKSVLHHSLPHSWQFLSPRASDEEVTPSSSDEETFSTLPPRTPPRRSEPSAIKPSPRTKAITKFFRRHKPLGGSASSESDDNSSSHRTGLRNVTRSEKKGWKFVSRISTEDVWRQFDKMRNDFISPQYVQDDLVNVRYSGHPLDCPRDIRARPFRVDWASESGKPPSAYVQKPRPVFRVTYYCDGRHPKPEPEAKPTSKPVPTQEFEQESADSEGHQEASDQAPAEDQATSDEGPSYGPMRSRCPQHVKLVVEVMSDDLAHANIWAENGHEHVPKNSKLLGISRFLRQGILESANLRMTAGKIKQRVSRVFKSYKIPSRRKASPSQIENIVQNARRQGRLDADPIKAIGVFAEANPGRIFNYEVHDPTANPPKKFSTGITDEFSLESLILYGGINGTALDSSYRHKNEERAPVTFFATINDASHLLPGTAYISEDIQEETLVQFLEATRDNVVRRAQQIANDESCIVQRKHRVRLLEMARRIAKLGTWAPAWVMIDKNAAGRNA